MKQGATFCVFPTHSSSVSYPKQHVDIEIFVHRGKYGRTESIAGRQTAD